MSISFFESLEVYFIKKYCIILGLAVARTMQALITDDELKRQAESTTYFIL